MNDLFPAHERPPRIVNDIRVAIENGAGGISGSYIRSVDGTLFYGEGHDIEACNELKMAFLVWNRSR